MFSWKIVTSQYFDLNFFLSSLLKREYLPLVAMATLPGTCWDCYICGFMCIGVYVLQTVLNSEMFAITSMLSVIHDSVLQTKIYIQKNNPNLRNEQTVFEKKN